MSAGIRKEDASIKEAGISRSASVLAAILVIFSIASAYMLLRLYQTSSQLAKSNRKTFILETKNKKAILEEYFKRRAMESANFAENRVFETYFAAEALGIPRDDGLEVICGTNRGEAPPLPTCQGRERKACLFENGVLRYIEEDHCGRGPISHSKGDGSITRFSRN